MRIGQSKNSVFEKLGSHRTARIPRKANAVSVSPLNVSVNLRQFKGTLKPSDRLLRSAGSYVDEYRVRIAPGKHRVEITLTANRFMPKVQWLEGRTNRVIDSGSGKTAQLNVAVEQSGLYKLRVLSNRSWRVGQYQLSYRVTPAVQVRSLSQDNTAEFDPLSGYGLVNAGAAVARAVGQADFPDVVFDEGVTATGQAYFWGLDRTRVPEVWAQGFRGQGITIAVVDDGINANHPALQNTLWTNADELPGNGIDDDRNGYVDDVQGWNFVDNNSNIQPTGFDSSHGTFIAGVLAGQPASGNSTLPIAAQQRTLGVAPNAKLMAVKVMSSTSQNQPEHVAQGIRYAVDNGARIVNLSLGMADGALPFSTPDAGIDAALQYARQRGVLVVMAAGNERQQGAIRPSEPAFGAARDLGIAVGAIDRSGGLASFSNPAGNRTIDYVTAPGADIFSTISSRWQQSYNFSSGTSFAAPYVAGIAALMLSANPALSPAQMEAILTQTAS
ncbi:S8 family serine peptidase [Leptolyngbya ohadii]|uniref:S8 family serine peptidase n=1 Tax=Leptolyngbya ohadii TaxID=1962290 RepID=UPI0015C66B25|nr:S8 family serine peptidase [Leptolyngbya ohadii]